MPPPKRWAEGGRADPGALFPPPNPIRDRHGSIPLELTEEEGVPGVGLEHVGPVLVLLGLPEVAPAVAGQGLRDVLHVVHLQGRLICGTGPGLNPLGTPGASSKGPFPDPYPKPNPYSQTQEGWEHCGLLLLPGKPRLPSQPYGRPRD